MAAMKLAGAGHGLPAHVHVLEDAGEYRIELDVSDFTEDELEIEVVGPRVTVRGEQVARAADAGEAFRLSERLVETFRLPDDAAAAGITAAYDHGILELRVPRVRVEAHVVPIEHTPYRVSRDAVPC